MTRNESSEGRPALRQDFAGNRATLQNLELLKGQKCEPAVTLDLECAGFAVPTG